MRKRYIERDGHWVEIGADYVLPSIGPMVMRDIKPYQAMGVDVATGNAPVIDGRSQHREYMRRNNYIEIGNEQPKLRTEVRGDFNVRAELTAAVEQVMRRRQ